MTTPLEAIAILQGCDATLLELLGELSADARVVPATIGGGDWSAKDLLAHVAFWEELALQALDTWRAGELPPRYDADTVNARNYEASRGASMEAVEARYHEAHSRLMQELGTVSAEEWGVRRSREGREFSVGELLGGITGGSGPFNHVEAHLPDLRAYVERVRVPG